MYMQPISPDRAHVTREKKTEPISQLPSKRRRLSGQSDPPWPCVVSLWRQTDRATDSQGPCRRDGCPGLSSPSGLPADPSRPRRGSHTDPSSTTDPSSVCGSVFLCPAPGPLQSQSAAILPMSVSLTAVKSVSILK